MSVLLVSFHSELARLGWPLIHLLWQGLVVAAVLELALLLAGNSRARLRYFLCGLALAALPVCFVLTYAHLGHALVAPMLNPAPETGVLFPADAAPVAVDPLVAKDFSQASAGARFRLVSAPDWNALVPYVTWAWLAGVMILGARKAGGLIVLARLRRRGVDVPDGAMMELFRRACVRMGIDPRRVCLRISHLVRVPMTMGWLSPIVLFPAALASGLSTGEIELILAHELAHIRRWDYLVNLLQAVVETLFFYHPLTWWISRRMRQERENCCDDLVANAPQEKLAYARTLLRLEELRGPGSALAPAATGGVLRRRIERLVSEPASGMAGGISVALVLLLTLGAGAAISAVPAAPATTAVSPAHDVPVMTAAEAKEKGIAALVNGHPILVHDVALRGYGKAVDGLIDRELELQAFQASGRTVNEKWVDDSLKDFEKSFDAKYHGDHAAFVRDRVNSGITPEHDRQDAREEYMIGSMRDSEVSAKETQYFQDHRELFPQEKQMSVTLIMLDCPTGKTTSDPESKATELLANQLLDEVKHGADFDSVAKEHLGQRYFPSPTMWLTESGVGNPVWYEDKAVWTEAAKLEPGQITGVIQGKYCYYIGRLNERRAARMAPTADRLQQEGDLNQKVHDQIWEAWLADLRAKAKIQVFDGAQAGPSTTQAGPRVSVPLPVPTTTSVSTAGPVPADSPVQQNYISNEVTRLTARLQLSPVQAVALRSAMEAMVHGTARKTVDQVLKEMLSPQQEAAWEEVKKGARLTEAGQSAAYETGAIERVCGLSDAQRKQIFDTLFSIELKYPDYFSSSAEMSSALTRKLDEKEAALGKILTPGQLLIYGLQARQNFEWVNAGGASMGHSLGVTRLEFTDPPAVKDFTPAPAPLPLNQLPAVNLSYAMPKVQASDPPVASGRLVLPVR